MKKSKAIIIIIAILVFGIIFSGCNAHDTITDEYQLIRIHIRANSNSDTDQAVKLKVRDSITSYLEKELVGVEDFETAYAFMQKNLKTIIACADEVLANEGFDYKTSARLNTEFFPTRSYDTIVVESGYYDALIVELGEGEGDNWWCVIYPPLCYLEAQGAGGSVEYRSYIAEIFGKFFGG